MQISKSNVEHAFVWEWKLMKISMNYLSFAQKIDFFISNCLTWMHFPIAFYSGEFIYLCITENILSGLGNAVNAATKKISVKSKFELLSVSKHGSECTPEGVRRSLKFSDYVCQAYQHYRNETFACKLTSHSSNFSILSSFTSIFFSSDQRNTNTTVYTQANWQAKVSLRFIFLFYHFWWIKEHIVSLEI